MAKGSSEGDEILKLRMTGLTMEQVQQIVSNLGIGGVLGADHPEPGKMSAQKRLQQPRRRSGHNQLNS